MNFIARTFLIFIFLLNLAFSSGQAAIFDVEAHGVYGGFWRDLYKFGPVVIDTVGGDLGIFVSDNFKTGFSFATIVGILSDDPNDDIFGSVYYKKKKSDLVDQTSLWYSLGIRTFPFLTFQDY